jgi:formylglycine-generating enzyme required for sulfatase activity
MCGNVWEWCYDATTNSQMRRTMCGGSYRKNAENVTVSTRDYAPVSRKYDDVGFRVVKFALSARDAK